METGCDFRRLRGGRPGKGDGFEGMRGEPARPCVVALEIAEELEAALEAVRDDRGGFG